jgi:vancomycin resistance protein VanJ
MKKSKVLNEGWVFEIIKLYFVLLGGWGAIYFLWKDSFGIMGLIIPFAKFLFLPILLLLPMSLITRQRKLAFASGISILVFYYFWGGLLLPKNTTPMEVDATLKVITYNAKGPNLYIDDSVAMILGVDADVVLIQELNLALGAALANLIEVYPYQLLNPIRGVSGMGIVSKYPLTEIPISLDRQWVGEPMFASLEFNQQAIQLLNVHLIPPFLGNVDAIINIRDRQAQSIRDFIHQIDEPVIVGGDFNATSLSTTYQIIDTAANDTWAIAGQGFGHTFPGKDFQGGYRPKPLSLSLPEWLIRIDYLFYTEGITPLLAQTAPSPDFSDHRGVIGIFGINP